MMCLVFMIDSVEFIVYFITFNTANVIFFLGGNHGGFLFVIVASS